MAKEYIITIKVSSDLWWQEIKSIIDENVTDILEEENITVISTYVKED